MFKSIEPEVAGGLGEDTILDTSVYPPIIHRFHHEFQGWLFNDIIEAFPCFIVTEKLKKAISEARLSGAYFDDVKISAGHEFKQFNPQTVLPEFTWMKIIGKAGEDDFGISDNHLLIISEKAYELLSLFNISEANVKDYISH
jgi:hypothetical protein